MGSLIGERLELRLTNGPRESLSWRIFPARCVEWEPYRSDGARPVPGTYIPRLPRFRLSWAILGCLGGLVALGIGPVVLGRVRPACTTVDAGVANPGMLVLAVAPHGMPVLAFVLPGTVFEPGRR